MKMQIGRWGNSLAVRLPRAIIDKFGLREGDAIDTEALELGLAELKKASADKSRQEALEEIRSRRWVLPADWKFDRDEANWRPAMDKW